MSAQNGTTEENITLMDKGKGKAVEQPQQEVEMGEAESSEEEESGAEEHVSLIEAFGCCLWLICLAG